ncbi:hypothetical protein [Mycobacterium sp. Marseille-P9652]|uniref:hypothetical protein n=1 Tax=Mycobacterium sp. Marseille-P9652 TaxID=2654950 RepID=UPI0012E91883|nr:hypothetical protein [Mycobacterium sp. Marseille-P9652]
MKVIDAIVKGYRETLKAVPYGDGHLVSLPTTFASGNLVTVLVTIDDGVVTVTDRGLAADELSDAGLDFSSGRLARSFAAVRDSTGLPPMFGAEEWELTAAADAADVAVAIQAVADAAIRAEGLRALAGSRRSATFADRAIDRVAARTPVVPRARMPGKYGPGRLVTLSYAGRDSENYYLQALAGRDSDTRIRSYDHASGLFLGATPSLNHRVALLQKGDWEPWQVHNLTEVCKVIDETEADQFIAETAA